MTVRELSQFRSVMHHHVVASMKDGTTAEGHIQPWDSSDDPTIYLTPLSGVGETKKLPLHLIDSIRVVE